MPAVKNTYLCFCDLHVIAFVKNDRITISVPIILSINLYRVDNLCRVDIQVRLYFPTNYYSKSKKLM